MNLNNIFFIVFQTLFINHQLSCVKGNGANALRWHCNELLSHEKYPPGTRCTTSLASKDGLIAHVKNIHGKKLSKNTETKKNIKNNSSTRSANGGTFKKLSNSKD